MTIQIGDTVRIVRKVIREKGWNNGWNAHMDMYVGDGVINTVTDVGTAGVYLDVASYGWPHGALDIVSKAQPKESKMISMDKKYKSDGRPVRILCVDGPLPDVTYPVIAMFLTGEITRFTADGRRFDGSTTNVLDLIEVSPYEDFKVDEPVMVRDFDEEEWKKRYFAMIGKTGNPRAWLDGMTSWTVEGDDNTSGWNQCRRPTQEELKGTAK